uniref:Uncharacterized protein n=1 Tax=Meloidogyne enterolobii TaxID=390850 RepID=A0A6V7YAF7_MELEN|nr:unnamed protein product [Meloidogyne enterolobii]
MISFSYAIISRNFINKLKYPKIHLIRTFSLSNLRNKIADEFDNSAFENTFGFNFKKNQKTSKEVEERLIAILYKFDKRKDFLFNLGSQMHWDMGIKLTEIDEFLDFVETELDVDMHKGHFLDFKTLRDVHSHICKELFIPNDRKTIRQKKAEQKKEAEEEREKSKIEQAN